MKKISLNLHGRRFMSIRSLTMWLRTASGKPSTKTTACFRSSSWSRDVLHVPAVVAGTITPWRPRLHTLQQTRKGRCCAGRKIWGRPWLLSTDLATVSTGVSMNAIFKPQKLNYILILTEVSPILMVSDSKVVKKVMLKLFLFAGHGCQV